ncbi:MAG: PPK2 family polyphosphate kinase [Betaproteobacteria bacterium]
MNKKTFNLRRIDSHKSFSLADVPTAPPAEPKKSQLEAVKLEISELSARLNKLQLRLHASNERGVLLVLQGMDTSGKDGAIRHVFSHVSPLGVRAEPFGAPSEDERRHDYLWRVHAKAPRRGELVVFNRSHYEDVLVTRVRGWISKAVCKQRYQHIQAFERMLSDEGIGIIKCYLHISKQEQKLRLQARMDDPDKHWKLQTSDFEDRRLWKDYIKAYEDAINATSTDYAPWYVIPADSKVYRDYFLMTLLVDTLEGLKIKPPDASFDLKRAQLD